MANLYIFPPLFYSVSANFVKKALDLLEDHPVLDGLLINPSNIFVFSFQAVLSYRSRICRVNSLRDCRPIRFIIKYLLILLVIQSTIFLRQYFYNSSIFDEAMRYKWCYSPLSNKLPVPKHRRISAFNAFLSIGFVKYPSMPEAKLKIVPLI